MNCVTCKCPIQVLNGDHLRAKCARCAEIPWKRGARKSAIKVTRRARPADPTLEKIGEFMRGGDATCTSHD